MYVDHEVIEASCTDGRVSRHAGRYHRAKCCPTTNPNHWQASHTRSQTTHLRLGQQIAIALAGVDINMRLVCTGTGVANEGVLQMHQVMFVSITNTIVHNSCLLFPPHPAYHAKRILSPVTSALVRQLMHRILPHPSRSLHPPKAFSKQPSPGNPQTPSIAHAIHPLTTPHPSHRTTLGGEGVGKQRGGGAEGMTRRGCVQ